VEAAGVEPASENIPLRHLHTCPEFWISLSGAPPGRDIHESQPVKISPHLVQASRIGYPASRRPYRTRRSSPAGR